MSNFLLTIWCRGVYAKLLMYGIYECRGV